MSVPAHTHLDPHPNICAHVWNGIKYVLNCEKSYNNNDTYEDYIKFNINYDASIKYGEENCVISGDDGFMPYITCFNDYDAMYYLFHTMNQITQHFPSDDIEGNNNLPLDSNELIVQKLSAWGDPPTSVNSIDIADKTLNFCVGATASLFYWFGIRAGKLKTEINYQQLGCEISNPTFTIKSTDTITLLPGFEFEAKNEHDEFKALILDCDQLSGQIP